MQPGAPQTLAKLEREILGYLLRNPAGEDSIEGIVEWWLLEQRTMEANQNVRQALAALRERGFVEARNVTGGRTVYGLSAEHRREAEAAWKRRPRRESQA